MSSFFLLNNLHFALEVLGSLAFLVVAWLAFDAFLIRRDFITASRGVGFIFLALWQVVHAFNFTSDLADFAGYALYLLGLIFILWNMFLEKPVERPEFKAILILPSLGALVLQLNIVVAAGFLLITFLAYTQYKKELKKSLMPFLISFSFLSLGALTSIFYAQDSLGALWILGHIFQLAGFLALGWWVWSYLALRIREELLMIFLSFTLFTAILVSLTFSTILISRIEAETKANLFTDVKVLDLVIKRFEQESLAKAKFIATSPTLKSALQKNNFIALEAELNKLLESEALGFLTVVDKDGYVVLRAHALSKKDDILANEVAVKSALGGNSYATLETSSVEKFSIRAASPLVIRNEIVGAVVAGFPLDSVFADKIKKVTGLEMSIFEGDIKVATTMFNADGRTRSIGIRETNPRVLETVIANGKDITLRTTILSNPFVASYLPLKDNEGEIIGMLSAARKQSDIAETANTTNRLTLVIVVIIMLILVAPIYLITKRLSQEMH